MPDEAERMKLKTLTKPPTLELPNSIQALIAAQNGFLVSGDGGSEVYPNITSSRYLIYYLNQL